MKQNEREKEAVNLSERREDVAPINSKKGVAKRHARGTLADGPHIGPLAVAMICSLFAAVIAIGSSGKPESQRGID